MLTFSSKKVYQKIFISRYIFKIVHYCVKAARVPVVLNPSSIVFSDLDKSCNLLTQIELSMIKHTVSLWGLSSYCVNES